MAIKATDRLGNVSKVKSGKVRIDRTAPSTGYDFASAKDLASPSRRPMPSLERTPPTGAMAPRATRRPSRLWASGLRRGWPRKHLARWVSDPKMEFRVPAGTCTTPNPESPTAGYGTRHGARDDGFRGKPRGLPHSERRNACNSLERSHPQGG